MWGDFKPVGDTYTNADTHINTYANSNSNADANTHSHTDGWCRMDCIRNQRQC